MEAILLILGFLAIIPILIIYEAFSWGYVASVIYGWFILTTFPQAPVLTWIQLAGIMFLVNCFVHNTTTNYIKKEYKDEIVGLGTSLIAPWLTLLGAWIFKIFFF